MIDVIYFTIHYYGFITLSERLLVEVAERFSSLRDSPSFSESVPKCNEELRRFSSNPNNPLGHNAWIVYHEGPGSIVQLIICELTIILIVWTLNALV